MAMRSFRQHLGKNGKLDDMRVAPPSRSVLSRLDEGVSKFEIDLDDIYLDNTPLNSSKRAQYELEELAKLTRSECNTALIETPILALVGGVLDEHGVYIPEPSRKRMIGVLYDVRTACLSLQYHHGRVRPRTLAEVYGIKLPPTYCEKDTTPSYPSTRSTQFSFLALYLGERFPNHEEDFIKLSEDLDRSLMSSALHYRSDIESSHELARYLFNALKRKM